MRSKQAETTRNSILDGLEATLADPTTHELSIAAVAQQAGVSEATVFRHFPNKPALFEGFSRRAAETFRLSPHFADDLSEVAGRIPDLFAYFRANQTLLLAIHRVPELHAFSVEVRLERKRRIVELVQRSYPHLDEAQLRAAAAQLHWVLSVQSWTWMTQFYEMDDAQAVATATEVFNTLKSKLDRDPRRAPTPAAQE